MLREATARASFFGRIRRHAFGIPPTELDFERRGFHPGDPADREHLEAVAYTFVDGYHAALLLGASQDLAPLLERKEARLAGFGFEGAAMALAVVDQIVPWRRGQAQRWRGLATGQGARFIYLLHIGAGWADARLRRPPLLTHTPENDVLRWLTVDGYGFHCAFFEWRATVAGRPAPREVPAAARPVFDHGVGRALWFGCCAEPERVHATIDALDAVRRADLWSGVGLAASYAGRRRNGALSELVALAGPHRAALAQGVAFAAEARALQGAVDDAVMDACEVTWGVPVERVVAEVQSARVAGSGSLGDYLAWGAAVRKSWEARGRR